MKVKLFQLILINLKRINNRMKKNTFLIYNKILMIIKLIKMMNYYDENNYY